MLNKCADLFQGLDELEPICVDDARVRRGRYQIPEITSLCKNMISFFLRRCIG